MDRDNDMAAQAVAAPTGELEGLFQAHHARVYRAAFRITGNASDAEDALQTVFLRLLRRSREAGPIQNVETYLQRAAVNAALDLVRQREPKELPLDEAAPEPADDPRRRPDRRQDARELRAALRRALARLSPKAAEIFSLRYFEGYDNPAIAELLGLSYADVAATLHRGRKRLEEEMRSYLGDRS